MAAFLALSGCQREPPPARYQMTGQVLAVQTDKLGLTVKHDDIPNYMPAMTMTYTVGDKSLLQGREPGEIISATLEVRNGVPEIVAVKRTGTAPLPPDNQLAMVAGILAEGDEVPDAAFIDQADRRRSFGEWRGSLTLLTFIYLRCPLPNYCPLMDQNFSTIQRAAAEEPLLKGQVKLVSITFDPEHDTPALLREHAVKLKADTSVWTFLGGDRPTVHRFAGRFGVSVIRPEGITEINHNLRTVLIGKDGRVLKIYKDNDWTPGTVLADLRAALNTK